MPPNQNPEQIARDVIDAQLRASGWAIQAKDAISFNAGEGQAVREYTTDSGPADYAALKRSEALRQSILKRAFSGRLVPQDPTDEPAAELLERIRAEREVALAETTRRKRPTVAR